MTKAKAIAKSIPEIYAKVNSDASRQHCCLVEDVHGQFFLYGKPQENNVVATAIQKKWDNFNKFSEEPKQTLLTYHANIFNAEPPKDQDLVTTAIYTWFGLCDKATNRVNSTTPKTEEGRKSTISSSKYFLTEENGETQLKTPQALACYRIARDTIKAKEAKDTENMPEDVKKAYIPSITEGELRQAVEARAGELRTRQNPWRIFQYYRPEMIRLKVLRRE